MRTQHRVFVLVGVAVLVIAALAFALAHGGGIGVDQIGQHKEYVIHMDVDGRTIPCVELRTDHGASISCDWSK